MAPTIQTLPKADVPHDVLATMHRTTMTSTLVFKSDQPEVRVPTTVSIPCLLTDFKKTDLSYISIRLGFPLVCIRDSNYIGTSYLSDLELARKQWQDYTTVIDNPVPASIDAGENSIMRILSASPGVPLKSQASTVYLMRPDGKDLDTEYVLAMCAFVNTHGLRVDPATQCQHIVWEKMTPDNFKTFWDEKMAPGCDLPCPVSRNCAQCGKVDAKNWCGKCHAVRYCSKGCQSTAWYLHKQTCVQQKQVIPTKDEE